VSVHVAGAVLIQPFCAATRSRYNTRKKRRKR
jgi:hypothetical protein